MDLETIALMATLSAVMHQLAHARDNAKNPKVAAVLAPIITALQAAISGLAGV